MREEPSVVMLGNVAIGKCMAPGLGGEEGERLRCLLYGVPEMCFDLMGLVRIR